MKYYVLDPQSQLLLWRDADGRFHVPSSLPFPLPADETRRYDMSAWAGGSAVAFGAAEVSSAPAFVSPDAMQGAAFCCLPLRDTWGLLSSDDYRCACHAATWIHWERTSRYCPVCGAPLLRHLPMGKRCPQCGQEHFPHISPAIIVRISWGDRILLVHAKTFRQQAMYGLVAGFLEGGETLEECVAREVLEETSLRVTHVKYFASQPWPYPSGVMVAFTADYAGGELRLADGELADACWCDRQHLPDVIPQPMSIARQLIDDWLAARP